MTKAFRWKRHDVIDGFEWWCSAELHRSSAHVFKARNGWVFAPYNSSAIFKEVVGGYTCEHCDAVHPGEPIPFKTAKAARAAAEIHLSR